MSAEAIRDASMALKKGAHRTRFGLELARDLFYSLKYKLAAETPREVQK